MRNRRGLLVATLLSSLLVLPVSVRADPPTAAPAAGATPPAPATNGRRKGPRARPARPTPVSKEPARHTPEPAAAADAKPRPSGPTAGHEVVEHESRIEFDERMVRGQSAAGAIFLFQRTPSELKSIVEIPDSFRPKTVELLQPRGTP